MKKPHTDLNFLKKFMVYSTFAFIASTASASPVGGMMLAAGLTESMGKALGVINLISAVLCFGGLISAVFMYMMGRTEHLKQALVGAAVGGLAWVIVQTFFAAGGQNVDGLQITTPQ